MYAGIGGYRSALLLQLKRLLWFFSCPEYSSSTGTAAKCPLQRTRLYGINSLIPNDASTDVCQQHRSRWDGSWRSHLIRIYAVCHSADVFCKTPLFWSIELTKFKAWWVNFRIIGMNELTFLPKDTSRLWWESNLGPWDMQSTTLPTELHRLICLFQWNTKCISSDDHFIKLVLW